MKIINLGSKQRTIGKTGANSESSRSHGIIQLRIFDTKNNIIYRNKFHKN